MAGVLILSFDFELAWGTRVDADRADHAAGVEAAAGVVRRLLGMLDAHRVSATWATVGHLMLEPTESRPHRALYDAPPPRPSWFRGEWFRNIPDGDHPQAGRYHTPDLVEAIVNCPTHQELASHTFTHPELSDAECPAETARAELVACQRLAQRFGRRITSLVFPRNRVGNLAVVAETGHTCYRGPFNEWYRFTMLDAALRRPLASAASRLVIGGLRFVDEWCALPPPVGPSRIRAGLCEVPHGMFFPGSVGPSRFVPGTRQAAKAIKGLEAAARGDAVFSLFTHPHNFLPQIDKNLTAMTTVLRHAARMRDEGRLLIRTMAAQADATRATQPGRQEAAA